MGARNDDGMIAERINHDDLAVHADHAKAGRFLLPVVVDQLDPLPAPALSFAFADAGALMLPVQTAIGLVGPGVRAACA